jgi:hypothetical protein
MSKARLFVNLAEEVFHVRELQGKKWEIETEKDLRIKTISYKMLTTLQCV